MSFFQTILDSAENPQHSGSPQDLQSLPNLAQQGLPGAPGSQPQLHPILDVLGCHLQGALNRQEESQGGVATQQTVSDLSKPGTEVQNLQGLLGESGLNNLTNEISQRTGMNPQAVIGFLPIPIPSLALRR